MRSLIKYLLKNYGFLLFLLLEVFSFVLIFNYNNYQKVEFLNSANRVSASLYNSFNSVVNYFDLAKINTNLSVENARLKTVLYNNSNLELQKNSVFSFVEKVDSTFGFTAARVINTSVNKQLNYITLNKGRKHGIKPDQGIISSEGVVGVVTNVSDSYSMGLSVLNKRWSISAKLKKSGFYGSLAWDGSDYKYADLLEIPFHVELSHGDTIVTSGYSSIFPDGVLIGTIQSFEQPEGENYFNIKVKLAVNFKAISFVDVIENKNRNELLELENIQNDSVDN